MEKKLSFAQWGFRVGETLLRALLFALTMLIGSKIWPYLDFKASGVLADRGYLLEQVIYPIAFYTHIILGAIALVLGPFQFISFFRRKFITSHRTLGKVYLTSCILSGMAGLYIGFFALGGWVARLGFISMGALWIFTAYRSFSTIMAGKVSLHRNWVHRSYALTFAAVTLRVCMGILIGALGLTFEQAYPIEAWASWVPNLIVVELYLHWKKGTALANL